MPKKLHPTSCPGVTGGYSRDRERPVDREIQVVVCDGQVLGRIVRTIDPITHIGSRGQRLEAMQEPGRHVQMPKVVVVEKKCSLLAECRRIPSNVDEHVVNGTVGAADQLRLSAPRAPVHAADYAPDRTGLGVLDERSRDARCAEVVVEKVRVEGPGEQATVIAERLRDQDENVRKVGRFDTHMAMLS